MHETAVVERRFLEHGYLRLAGDRFDLPVGPGAAQLGDPALRVRLERDWPGYCSHRMDVVGRRPRDPGVAGLDALAEQLSQRYFGSAFCRHLQLTETWFNVRPGKVLMGPHIDGLSVDWIRPLSALVVVLLTPHDGESGLYVVPRIVPALVEALTPALRAGLPDAAAYAEHLGAVTDRIGWQLGNFEFLAGPAGSVFLLHPLAAHGVVHPPDRVSRQRRAYMRLYPPGLDLADRAGCLEHARRVVWPFAEWQRALPLLAADQALRGSTVM